VFALSFGLLLADYMSRQVLSAVFPFLKTEWLLSDSQLASLTSIVALMVGLLTLPLSMAADRWGRTRSLVLMAVLWSVATLLCAVAASYEQMLGARFLVGVGEAAYGSVGIALVLSVFAPRAHAALGGAFMAGGSFGSVLGVALGGAIRLALVVCHHGRIRLDPRSAVPSRGDRDETAPLRCGPGIRTAAHRSCSPGTGVYTVHQSRGAVCLSR
jgi:MFS family permease